ncbi:MAG: hypothetical protein LBQ66_08565 [Planctomycetaceae bacterium]|jgi:hypothetical protein|nr:hypothetical protein [Planctomycetaceae bacterium]
MTINPNQSANQNCTQNNVQTGNGFTAQQWVLLMFAFILGIASVMTIDKLFISNQEHAGSAHAGIITDDGSNRKSDLK